MFCMGKEMIFRYSQMCNRYFENGQLVLKAKKAQDEALAKWTEELGKRTEVEGQLEFKENILLEQKRELAEKDKKIEDTESKVQDLEAQIEGLKAQVRHLEDKHQRAIDDQDYNMALANSAGYKELREEIARDHPDLDLSRYVPPVVSRDALQGDGSEYESEEDDQTKKS